MSGSKKPLAPTAGSVGPSPSSVSAGARVDAIQNQQKAERIRDIHYRNVAQQQAWMDKNGSKAMRQKRWFNNVKYMQEKDPQLLKYLKEKFPKQVAEAERAIAAAKLKSAPKVVGPRVGPPKVGGFKAGFKAGVAGALSPTSLAALAAEIILAVADREAAKEAIRKIQTKYLREGFARGFAAGVMGWTDEEVQLKLKYHVRVENLQSMHDPGGILTRAQMFQLAQACDNYAVDYGFYYSSQRPNSWKLSMLKKGFSLLSDRGVTRYRRTEDLSVLFELQFIEDLAWVLKPMTDTLVTIRFS